MAAIVERPNGLYVKFRDPSGKQHWVTVYGGKKEATKRKTEIEAEAAPELRKAGLSEWKSPKQREQERLAAEAQARAEAIRFTEYAERAGWKTSPLRGSSPGSR